MPDTIPADACHARTTPLYLSLSLSRTHTHTHAHTHTHTYTNNSCTHSSDICFLIPLSQFPAESCSRGREGVGWNTHTHTHTHTHVAHVNLSLKMESHCTHVREGEGGSGRWRGGGRLYLGGSRGQRFSRTTRFRKRVMNLQKDLTRISLSGA